MSPAPRSGHRFVSGTGGAHPTVVGTQLAATGADAAAPCAAVSAASATPIVAAFAVIVALAGVLASPAAFAATAVYRCGVDARSFSDRPCPAGTAQATHPLRAATPSPADRDQARDVADAEQRLARTLRAERLERDANPPPVVVMRTRSLGPERDAAALPATATPRKAPGPPRAPRGRSRRAPAG